MRVLIADDDLVPRRLLQRLLEEEGHEVTAVGGGDQAWFLLQESDAPKLVILDWMMPGLDGLEVCRRVRRQPTSEPPYLILVTSRDSKEDVVAGLSSGANDYVTKPFDRSELRARVRVAVDVLELRAALARRVHELERALAEVKQLRQLLPICSYCKKIRGDKNYWEQVDHYLGKHSDLRFSHGICPECWDKEVSGYLKSVSQQSVEYPGSRGEPPAS